MAVQKTEGRPWKVREREMTELKKRNSELEAACAEMRAALEYSDPHRSWARADRPKDCRACNVLDKTDVGKGWVSPEQIEALALEWEKRAESIDKDLMWQRHDTITSGTWRDAARALREFIGR